MKAISLFFLVFMLGISIPLPLSGQANTDNPQVNKESEVKILEITEIPVRAVETITKTRQALQDLISESTIRNLWIKNTLVLSTVDTNLLKPLNSADPSINLRFLENKKNLLQREVAKISREEKELNEILGTMDTLTIWLKHESALWRNTMKASGNDSLPVPLLGKMMYTIIVIDSSKKVLYSKTQSMMEMLEKTIAAGVNVERYLDRTNELISRKEKNAFTGDHIPFFRLDFGNNFPVEIKQSLDNLKHNKARELNDYMRNHTGEITGLLVLFFLLLLFFFRLKASIKIKLEGYGRFYKDTFLVMLSRPLEVSIILGLVASVFIFPDKPLTFRELQTYIIFIPLISLLNRVLNKEYRFYLYLFASVAILYMIQVLLSSETRLYRVMLFIIAVVEIGLLSMILVAFRKRLRIDGMRKKMVILFIILHLVLAMTGLISNIAGRLILTEIAINAVFVNLYRGVIFFIVALLLNGIVVAGVDSFMGKKLNSFSKYGEKIKLRAVRIINATMVICWGVLVLTAFHLDTYLFALIGSILTHKFQLGTASFSLDFTLIFFSVIFISIYIARFLQVFLEEDMLSRMPISKGLPHTISMAVKYTLIIAGFLLAVNATGIPMDKLTIILGAFSVGIGFGLQSIFNNMVSGLILLFERPIQLGDTIQVGQLIGDVKSIDLRSSNIYTFDGAEVIVPNGQLVSNEVINWTLSDKKRRLEIPIGVGYESDPLLVHELMIGILLHHPRVLKYPEPLVFFSGLGESSLDFALVFWIADYNDGRSTKSDVLFKVFGILKENNIKIPFPQREIHISATETTPPGNLFSGIHDQEES